MRKILPVFLLALIALSACKKEKPEEKLDLWVGRWLDITGTNPDITAHLTLDGDGGYLLESTEHRPDIENDYSERHIGTYEKIGDTIYVTVTEKYKKVFNEWEAFGTNVLPEQRKAVLYSASKNNLDLGWRIWTGNFYYVGYERVHQ